ncbi:MAG: hypothetical protein NTY22_01555 [Proteobacteria bacterium]|nr:hypothetical protein [Pseudomonadota bacterium]
MKSIKLFCLFVLITMLFTCGGSGGGGGGGGSGAITIKGTLSGVHATDISQATKVIVFSAGGTSTVADVKSNGSFEINVDAGTPLGLIFAGASNNFLGYLTLGNGIESLPLTNVADGVTTIDLQTISTSGLINSPGHNPIGTEISLTSAEQTALAMCNGMFAAVVKNPDVDSNGVIDILESKFYASTIAYGVAAGNFGGAMTPTVNSTVTMDHYNIFIRSETATDAGGATVTGPSGSGITNSTCFVAPTSIANEVSYTIYADLGTSPTTIPTAGNYVFTLANGKVLTFSIPDQTQISSKIVVAIPTVTLNGNGTINKVNWVYRMPNDSSSNLTPKALIQNIIIQINDASFTRLYDSPQITSDIIEHTLTDQTIPWATVHNISMAYNDVYGNHYVVDFLK